MSTDDIPYATPYPWENVDMEETHKAANKKLRTRFVGSGFVTLQKQLGPNSEISDTAKQHLAALLKENGVELGNEGEGLETGNADKVYKMNCSDSMKRGAAAAELAEDEVLKQAREGKLSLFSSLLHVIETSEPPVATKTLFRKCCLTINAGDMTGTMDAKEHVLAALHFLSSNVETGAEDRFPSLPLIKPIQFTGDLEKRNYQKNGDWKLENIEEKLSRLEQVFINSPSSWKWLRREVFCPRLDQKDESSFFFKGIIPASASAKKPKGEYTRKRKVCSPAPSSSSVVNDSVCDSASLVEATVVAEGGGDD